MSEIDPYHLERFVSAQEPLYLSALAELRSGYKVSHWMWFVFPQIAGLGRSAMAQRYAISGAEEARAYLAHPVLGARLWECCGAILAVEGKSAYDILDSPDDMKLKSSMTLFDFVERHSVFAEVLGKYYQGERDERTLELLA
ncbi:DUF1810 domain-containing protein [soil metagenome]